MSFVVDTPEVARVADFISARSTALLVIMFVDIVESTRHAAEHGDGASDAMRRQFEELLIDQLKDDTRSMLLKFLGDGAIAVFTEPSYAIEVATNIQRNARAVPVGPRGRLSGLPLRIGLHLGQVTIEKRFTPDVFGLHVNKAARVVGEAPVGLTAMTYSVFDSAQTRLTDRSDLIWRYIGPRHLKGFDREERLYTVNLVDPSEKTNGALHLQPERLIHAQVGNYRVQEFLGFGGYGSVYRACHSTLNTEVALKISHWIPDEWPGLRELFDRGARAQAALTHPNIVKLFDYGEYKVLTEPRLVLAMEYVRGSSMLAMQGTIKSQKELRRLLNYCCAVCDAVHAAHNTVFIDKHGFASSGICHGDLKPRNILISESHEPKVIDFMMLDYQRLLDKKGRELRSIIEYGKAITDLFGTPGFMAPEQETGGVVTPRTDVFAMARTICDLLDSELSSLPTPEIASRLSKHPLVGGRLNSLLTKAMSPDPDQRFQSMRELGGALSRSLGLGVRLRSMFT